jgi:hypothetical protein
MKTNTSRQRKLNLDKVDSNFSRKKVISLETGLPKKIYHNFLPL